MMELQQLVIFFKLVLRQAQHERNINVLRGFPFGLSLSKGSCYEFIKYSSKTRTSREKSVIGMPTLACSRKLIST